jgi:hypothetical protein
MPIQELEINILFLSCLTFIEVNSELQNGPLYGSCALEKLYNIDHCLSVRLREVPEVVRQQRTSPDARAVLRPVPEVRRHG